MASGIMHRDGHRCVVTGCRNHRFLDVHHLHRRADGGNHDPERLALLCGAHDRNVHAGTLLIDGTASEGFTFRHADGTTYGGRLHPREVDIATEVTSALVHVGLAVIGLVASWLSPARARVSPSGRGS